MGLASRVKELCQELNVSLSELSRRLDQSPQNFGKKLTNDTLSYDEFTKVLDVLGVKLNYSLTLPNNKTIGDTVENVRTQEKLHILESQIDLQRKSVQYLLDISHDIRQNMSTITGSVEIAQNHIEDKAKIATSLDRINSASINIAELLNDISDIKSIPSNGGIFASVGDLVKGKRCLLVEDDALNREITKEILEDKGIIVDVAENGRIAIEKVDDREDSFYSFIIMDIQMPRMNGFEAASIIRKNNKKVPIIALTANTSKEDLQNAANSGMSDYLIKPIDPAQLLKVLASKISL